MVIRPGSPEVQGSTPGVAGTNFALWSSVAERVELCLFDEKGEEYKLDMPACDEGTWHGFVPDVAEGQRYGYRVHGPWDPAAGKRCNPAKLLLDPYALQIQGDLDWNGPVFDTNNESGERCDLDSARSVPMAVVRNRNHSTIVRPDIPWTGSILYECNVRGFTMRHPAVDESDRGRFEGMRNVEVLDYLKTLGITSIEFMPILAWIDEHHLAKRGLRNYWGYNTISFFAPMPRLGGVDPISELREAIRAFHDRGIEVILDVAYNHTGEGDHLGPTLSFRGIDNLAYYRAEAHDPGRYVNDTGCGNTINADHPQLQQLILDSLTYLHNNIGFDGFRFDLASVLGRHGHGFSTSHPLLERIGNDSRLRSAKLVAEPWDPGPGGYQLGSFPPQWAEWNDKYRDTVRRFWRGDAEQSGSLARRVHGSSDLFESSGRSPHASINFVTSHDGYTLADVVSYEDRHNHANGENNNDGHHHNWSRNYGVEGATDDREVLALRRRQRLNMLTTLLLSQGSPMLLAGDEFGHTQFGNNNAYAQDNETTWLDWERIDRDPEFLAQVRTLIHLRRSTPLLHIDHHVHGSDDSAAVRFEWINAAGTSMQSEEWAGSKAFTACIAQGDQATAVVVNGCDRAADFVLPEKNRAWRVAFTASELPNDNAISGLLPMQEYSIALLLSDQGTG